MSRIFSDNSRSIGNTPLVRLNHVAGAAVKLTPPDKFTGKAVEVIQPGSTGRYLFTARGGL